MFLDPRDPRQIVAAAIKYGDRDGSAPYISKLEGLCRQLSAELATMQGQDVSPHKGSYQAQVSLGDAAVLVEYDYQPEEAPVYDLNSPMCGPGCGAAAEIFGVYINGQWTDPRDIILPATLQRWESEILERHEER